MGNLQSKYKYCNGFLEYINFKDDLIEYKCSCCNKNYQQKFDEKWNDFLIHRNALTMITVQSLKGYLHYKMITCQNMSSEAQIKTFFIS